MLKIVWPGIALTLLEATAKKTAFLSALVEELDIGDIRVLTGRAEDYGHEPGLRGAFDLVVARAVAPLPVLLELTLPFARVGGRVAAEGLAGGGGAHGVPARARRARRAGGDDAAAACPARRSRLSWR